MEKAGRADRQEHQSSADMDRSLTLGDHCSGAIPSLVMESSRGGLGSVVSSPPPLV